jgi:hypothetical protein
MVVPDLVCNGFFLAAALTALFRAAAIIFFAFKQGNAFKFSGAIMQADMKATGYQEVENTEYYDACFFHR